MARYVREVVLNRPGDFVQFIMTDFLSKHGFKLVEFKGEQVYRVGGGIVELPKFLTWGYQNGVFHIEAWTRSLWLPGVYGDENDLTGLAGSVPKRAYKKDIEELIGLLFQPIYANGPQEPEMQSQKNIQQPIYVKGADMAKYAGMALIFALIGLVTAFLSSFVGLFFGSFGFIYGNKAKNSSKNGMATAAVVISVIAWIIAVICGVCRIIWLSSLM